MAGRLIAFEGLDQSGKQTQAERLAAMLRDRGYDTLQLSFPDYATPIGSEIGRALRNEREYGADVMQLLYVANRYEFKSRIERMLGRDGIVVCDRYVASSVAYGEAQGLDPAWLVQVQQFLPQPDLTILLDIAPATAVGRKSTGRDRYERDLAMLERVRASYGRQAAGGWLRLDGERDRDTISGEIATAVEALILHGTAFPKSDSDSGRADAGQR